MRAFAAVFTREVFARRLAFPVALAAGFVPIIGSLVYGWSTPDAAEGRVLVGFVAATALSSAFALLLGASMIVGETSERRISFFFARPIPAAAIWGGKLLAAVFITFASTAITFTPAWLTGPGWARGIWGYHPGPGETLLGALAWALLLVLGSHAVVTIGRLRSPWVVLDLLLAPTLVFLAAIFLRNLLRYATTSDLDAANPAEGAAISLVGATFLASLVASLVQVAEGRTDARRAHGAFSAVFFGLSGLGVALLGGYVWWCASAKATDLTQVWGSVETAPRGPWLVTSGPLSALRGGGTFLFDSVGGRSLRLHAWDVAFSQDGTHAAWEESRFGFFERKDKRSDVVVADLGSGRVVVTGLDSKNGWSNLALSPDGRRLAVREGKTLAAYDVTESRNPRQIAAFAIPDDFRSAAFVYEDTIRLFAQFRSAAPGKDLPSSAFDITELSLSSKKSLVTGRIGRETLRLRLSADARFFVGTRKVGENATMLTLHDGRTGALIATLAEELQRPQARFLTGDRIAVAGIAGAQARLSFFEGERGWGAPSRSVEMGPAKRVVLGGETVAGRVAVALLPFEENLPASLRAAKLVAVDAATGAVSPLADGLLPADRMAWWVNPVMTPAEAGAPWSLLFLDADSRLVRLDPATGAQTVLLGKGK
jgi:ABC-type transport system involved in multi-copper enzyme maturation permease subunit